MSRRSVSSRPRFRAAVSFGGALLAVCFFSPLVRAEDSGDSLEQKIRAVFEKCRDAVVKIHATDEHGPLAGSGFFIDPNGTLYTSYTIGGETHDILVLMGDKKIPAERLIADPRSGVAILKIDAQTPFIVPGKSSALAVSSPVMIVGYPMDLPLTPALGLVGGFDQKYLGRFFCTAHIRANVPVQRGEGGAPLLNLQGEAVGVLISSLENSSGCFALPIEAAEKIRHDFMRFGELRPGWIGVTVAPSTAVAGAEVESVAVDAPAAKSGIKSGDIVLQVGASKIKSPEDVISASFFLTAGDTVPIVVRRAGETLTIPVQAVMNPAVAARASKSGAIEALAPKATPKGVLLKSE